MSKKLITRNIFLGFLSWLVPFAISLLFYEPDGELTVPYAVFKTMIMAIGTLSGCYLLYLYFKPVDSDFMRNGIVTGLLWFAINIILDALILIPIMKTSFADYFMTIGLGYIAIPAISITVGYLLERKVKQN